MSKAKFIQENGETILPITHEEAVLDNDGKNLPSKYQQKQDDSLLTDAKTIVGAINELSTKGGGGGEGTITSVPYTEGSDLDIEQIGGGSDSTELENKVAELDNMTKFLNNEVFDHSTQIGTETLNTNSQTLSGAINELFTSANNGKNLIASAIGEPLSAEDTFQAMSDDINGLLSTFKTNMMNNGVTVESGDRFKSLIDKIATMADSGDKGVKFAQGTCNVSVGAGASVTIPLNLDFVPTIVICYLAPFYQHHGDYDYNLNSDYSYGFVSSEVYPINYSNKDKTPYYIRVESLTSQSFVIHSQKATDATTSQTFYFRGTCQGWYAIGVGEEDTTLRDSLASILQDSGVEVTEEDDMASLISKVDTKLDESGGLDIISATTLPREGKENQLCVLTDTPVDKFVISNSSSNKPSDAVLLVTSSSSNFPISITTGNLTTNYLFDSIYYNGQVLESYFYTNNQWNKVTEGLEIIYIVENKVFSNSTVIGGIETGTQFKYTSGTGLVLARPSNWWAAGTFANRIDFSKYTTLTFTAYCTSSMEGCEFYAGVFTYPLNAGTYSEKQPASAVTNSVVLPSNSPKEYTFDISSWDFSGYLGFAQNSYYDVVITNLNLTKE